MQLKKLSHIALLGLALVLTACGGDPAPTPQLGTPPTEGTGTAQTFKLEAGVPDEALRSGDMFTVPVRLTPQNGFAGPVIVQLINPPAGVMAAPLTVNLQGATTVNLTVTTTKEAAGLLQLGISATAGSVTQKDTSSAFVYRVVTLPSGGENCLYPTCRFPALQTRIKGGRAWAIGITNSVANETVMSVDIATGQVRAYQPQLKFSDAIGSFDVVGDKVWMGVYNFDVPALLSMDITTGATERYEVGRKHSSVTETTVLPDGRIAFLLRDSEDNREISSVGIFAPSTGTFKLTPVSGGAFDLEVGPDGALWIAGSIDASIIRFDPITQAIKTFSMATNNYNRILELAVTSDNKVWFQDTGAMQFGILDAITGDTTRYAGTINYGQLHPLGDSVLFTEQNYIDPRLVLFSKEATSLRRLTVPTITPAITINRELDAFSVDENGSMVYESNGELYILPSQYID